MKNFKNLVVGCGLLSLAACGKLNDMHDATMSMNSTTKTMADNTASMLKQMTDLNTQIVAMKEQMKELNSKMDALPEMNASMKDLRNDIKSLNAAIVEMNTKMNALPEMNQNMKDLRGDMSLMNAAIIEMNKKMNALPEMNTNMTDLHTAILAMNKEIIDMNKKMDALPEMNGNMKDLTDMMKKLKAEIVDMNKKMDALTAMGKAMDEMNIKMNALPDMAKKMESLPQMLLVMQGMNSTLDLTHSDLRLIFTSQHRIEALNAMEASKDIVAKMGYAAEYMVAQTYQAWNSKADPESRRLDYMGMAVYDFFFKMTNYMRNRELTDATKTDEQMQNIYAIAAALDYVNLIELEGLKGTNLKVVTMNSMIEDGLRMRAAVNSGKVKLADLPVYQREVLNHEQDAVYLLRVRQNFLKGVGYSVTTLSENGDNRSKLACIWDIFKGRIFGAGWNADLQNKEVAQLEIIATTLDSAAETESFLMEIGINPMIDKNVGTLLRKMNVSSLAEKASLPEGQHFNRALSQIVELDNRNW